MRMPRPVWSGTITFGLVAIPSSCSTRSAKSVSFNQLDDRSMAASVRRRFPRTTGEDVPDEHIVKGYEVSKDRYVVVDPDELEPFIPSATKTIDLEEFVDLNEIDPVYFDSAYIVAPDKNPKPYVLLARAMEEGGKVAIGRFVMRNKQYTAAIRAQDGRLVMTTMVFADEVVDPATIEELDVLDEIDVSPKEVKMAEALVDSLTADFEPAKYRDEYREQVLDLIRRRPPARSSRCRRSPPRSRGRRPDGRARGERQGGQAGTRPPSGRSAELRRRRRGRRSLRERRRRDRRRWPAVDALQPRQGAVPGGVHQGRGDRLLRAHRAGDGPAPQRVGASR